MTQQIADTAGHSILRQLLQRPLHQRHQNGQNLTGRSDGSGAPRRSAGFEISPPLPPPPPQLMNDVNREKRRKHNEASKRSREKIRLNRIELERKMTELRIENFVFRTQLAAIEREFGVRSDDAISVQQIMSMLPTDEQMFQQTTAAAAVHWQNGPSCSTSGSRAIEQNGHPGKHTHWRQHQRQQHHRMWQQQRDGRPDDDFGDVRRFSAAMTGAAGAGCVPRPFAPVLYAPPPPPLHGLRRPSADGALDLSLASRPAPLETAAAGSDDGPTDGNDRNGVACRLCAAAAAGPKSPGRLCRPRPSSVARTICTLYE